MAAISFDADQFCALLRQSNAENLAAARARLTGIDLLGVELQAQCLPAKEAFARVVIAAREQGHPDVLLGALSGALAHWMVEHVTMSVADQDAVRNAAIWNLVQALKGNAQKAPVPEFSISAQPAGRA